MPLQRGACRPAPAHPLGHQPSGQGPWGFTNPGSSFYSRNVHPGLQRPFPRELGALPGPAVPYLLPGGPPVVLTETHYFPALLTRCGHKWAPLPR